jgi:competence protein ComEC
MSFPFLHLAIALAGGIALGKSLSLSLPAAAISAVVALAAAWILYRMNRTAAAFAALLAATALFGAAWLARADLRYEANALRCLRVSVYGDFRGVLISAPAPGADRDHLFLRVESADIGGVETPASGNLSVSVPRSSEFKLPSNLAAGDAVKVGAQIVPPLEFRNFDEPFSRMYLRTRLLHAQASTKSPALVEKTGRRGGPAGFLRPISRLRIAFQGRIERYFASPTGEGGGLTPEGAALETLLLGGRGRLSPETTLALQKTGLFHLFAISGAHVGLVSLLLFGLLRLARVPRRTSWLLLIASLVFYGLLVEGRASVVRAVVMAVAFLLAKLFWKDAHLLQTIGISAFAILLANPFQLFDAGFQLTFAATIGIILLYPRLLPVAPRLPLKIGETFTLSLAAQAGVFPLIASMFNRIIFSGLLLNLIGIPLVGLIMAAGYVFLPLSFAGDAIARPAAAGLGLLVKAFMASTGLLDGLRFLSYRIPTPSGFTVAAYYLLLLLLLLPRRFRRIRVGAGAGFAAIFLILILFPFPSGSKDLTMTVLDVGQGESVLVEFPGRAKMLVDGGGFPASSFDVGESVVSRFLWDKGIKRVDTLVLTHAHPDHYSGLAAVARNFKIGEFWEADKPSGDPKFRALELLLAGVPAARPAAGFVRRMGGVSVEALFPPDADTGGAPASNDRSLVLRLTYGAVSVLLPGDIGSEAERAILESGRDVRARVLIAPHHGSASSSSEEFLRAVGPEMVIISAGRGNSYGFPAAEMLARCEQAGARILRTDRNGAVEVTTDGERLAARTSSGD